MINGSFVYNGGSTRFFFIRLLAIRGTIAAASAVEAVEEGNGPHQKRLSKILSLFEQL